LTKKATVVERSQLHLVLEVEGFDFSVLDSLQEVLNEMEEVEYAGTSVIHPLFPRLRFVLRVKEGHDVFKVLSEGLRRLRTRASEVVGILSETLAKAEAAKA
jgi:DNA-directed RNA polymerase subunit L